MCMPGHLLQVDGPNGAGKTSLLRILAGLSRYGFSGRLERRCPLLYLGHHSAVKALLTPRENLAWHVAGESTYSDAADRGRPGPGRALTATRMSPATPCPPASTAG